MNYPDREDIRRFASLVSRKHSDRCFRYLGPRDGDGYGRYTDETGSHAAHRFAYARTVDYCFGRLNHTCGNRWCVKADHLQEESERPHRRRFMAKVAVRGEDECWEWTGARSRAGYGVFRLNGKIEYAHRIMWELASILDDRPAAFYVGHTCGNRGCVNPRHLTETWGQTLDDLEALEIRERYEAGESGATLAREYYISRSMVSRIVNGTRWKNPFVGSRGYDEWSGGGPESVRARAS